MNKLVFASSNLGKLKEVRAILEPRMNVLSLADIEARIGSAAPEVEETADTYAGNAQLKADQIFAWCKLPALADDSGIEVDALGGRPGLYSARYAGKNCTAEDNINKVLLELGKENNRSAKMVCFLCLKTGEDSYYYSDGFIYGQLLHEKRGSAGFGYDPLFLLPDVGLTIAEVKGREPEFLTHRGRALVSLEKKIRNALA